MPSLRGRPVVDIVEAMKELRDGARQSTVMGRIAKGFADDETRAVAEWLARL